MSARPTNNEVKEAAKVLEGPLIRNDSVDRTLSILSDAWSFLALREIYLGARRFDQIQKVLHMPRSTLSARLAHLTSSDIIKRIQYSKVPGRYEYRLTERGIELYLVMLAMLRFGDDHLAGGKLPPLKLVHAKCGHQCRTETICSHCRKPIDALQVMYRDGPGAGWSVAPVERQRRRTSGVEAFERGRPSSVSRTLGILADRWTFLILRELFFGVRRFDGFSTRLGIAPNILADRLNRLVEQNILRRERYQEQPERFEYRLTGIGRDLYPTFIQMLRWGDRWLGYPQPLILRHKTCGHDFEAVIACDHCGETIDARDMRYHLNYPRLRGDHPPALLSAPDASPDT